MKDLISAEINGITSEIIKDYGRNRPIDKAGYEGHL